MRRGLALAILALAWAAPADAQPLVAAHRGGAALWPENSLRAFHGALALGVDFLETDIHLTADGEPIVLHDPTLDRTTTMTGPVGERRVSDLAAARLRGADGAATDEPIPTLGRLLALLAPGRVRLLLEIKLDANRRPYPGIEDKALALIRAHGVADRTLVMAFEAETLRRLRALDASIPGVLLVRKARVDREGIESPIREATSVGATHLGVDHRALAPDVVAAVRGAGLRLAAWTVNGEAEMRRTIELGIDILITDRPDLGKRLTGR